MSAMRWWVLAAAAALAAIGAALALSSRTKRTKRTPPSAPITRPAVVDAGQPCVDLQTVPTRALAAADTAAFVTETQVGTLVRLDGEVVFGSFDKPVRVSAANHTLRVESEGSQPVELGVHVDPFQPVLVDTLKSDAGLSVVLLGARCTTCGGIAPSLELGAPTEPSPTALNEANAVLATGSWTQAAELLNEVPRAQRKLPEFLHSFAATLANAGQRRAAEQTLASVGAVNKRRLADFAALDAPEQLKRADVSLKRWNLLTERYQRLADKFASTEVHGAFVSATSRMNDLSQTFAAAAKAQDLIGEEGAIEATEQVIERFVKDLRALKPTDCAWQAAITSTM